MSERLLKEYFTNRPGTGWAHMSCALWIPEVKIGNIEKMEPITNIEGIPVSDINNNNANNH